MSVQGTILGSVVGQQDERSISSLQMSDKGMLNNRIRHCKVVVKRDADFFLQKMVYSQEGS